MKDYSLGSLVEGKAWFNQNVQQIKKKVIMNVQLKTLSSILLFRVVRNSPFWTKGCLTSNQGRLQWPWLEVTEPSIQKGEFPTTVEWVVFFATPHGPNNMNKLAKLIVLPSALIWTDKHWCQWSAILTMMGNEGNDVIEDIDVLCPCHILLPYPDTSAYALAPYPLIFLKASASHWHYIAMKKSKIFR